VGVIRRKIGSIGSEGKVRRWKTAKFPRLRNGLPTPLGIRNKKIACLGWGKDLGGKMQFQHRGEKGSPLSF